MTIMYLHSRKSRYRALLGACYPDVCLHPLCQSVAWLNRVEDHLVSFFVIQNRHTGIDQMREL